MTTTPTSQLESLFQHELQSINDDVRRKAALAAFRKFQPGNRVTVEQLLTSLQQHKDVWAAVASLTLVDFAEALAGRRELKLPEEPASRRTRINDEQKNTLKSNILRVLDGKVAGLTRIEVTAAIIVGGLAPAGIDRAELPEKVRQPLHELVAEGKLHTVGEKRLMKYVFGGKKGR